MIFERKVGGAVGEESIILKGVRGNMIRHDVLK